MTWSPDQENKTVKQCVSGDTQAQEKLYHHYSGLLFSICMRYAPNREMAQDFLQEAFIKAFKSLNRFRFEGSFEGWLKRLTVNSCLDQLKKHNRIPFQENIETAYNLGTKHGVLEALEAQSMLKMMQDLPDGYRTVFNLFAIEGYSHAEIAAELGVSESTSKSQLFKARKSLQAMLAARTNE